MVHSRLLLCDIYQFYNERGQCGSRFEQLTFSKQLVYAELLLKPSDLSVAIITLYNFNLLNIHNP